MGVFAYGDTDSLFLGKADLSQRGSLAVNDRVRIVGLSRGDAQKYNGCGGSITSEADGERYGIIVDGSSKVLAVRRSNLQRLFQSAPGSDTKEITVADFPKPTFPPVKLPLSFHDSCAFQDALELRDSNTAHDVGSRLPTFDKFNSRNLVVAPSTKFDGGLGVFCGAIPMTKGAVVTQYAGWRVPHDHHSSGNYIFRLDDFSVEGDALQQDVAHGVGQLMNDAGSIRECDLVSLSAAVTAYIATEEEATLEFELVDGVVVGFAVKDIAPGTELFHRYGAAYWLGKLASRLLRAHDISTLRQVESLYPPDDARSVISSLTLGASGLLCAARPATGDQCSDVMRALIGHGHVGYVDLALVALLQGSSVDELDDAIGVLEDNGGMNGVKKEFSAVQGYRQLKSKVCLPWARLLRQVPRDPDNLVEVILRNQDLLVAGLQAAGILRGLCGYNRVVHALRADPGKTADMLRVVLRSSVDVLNEKWPVGTSPSLCGEVHQ